MNHYTEHPTDLNELAKLVHQANKQWWIDLETGQPIECNKGELLALVISKLCECLEGERRNLMDDHLPHRRMAEVELADAKIRLLDFAGGFGISLHGEAATAFRGDNKGEALYEIIQSVSLVRAYSFYITVAVREVEAYAAKHGYNLEGAFWEKMEYNRTRADHKVEARKLAGGKKF